MILASVFVLAALGEPTVDQCNNSRHTGFGINHTPSDCSTKKNTTVSSLGPTNFKARSKGKKWKPNSSGTAQLSIAARDF